MSAGFKPQSNFFTAFQEITGLSPGQYRKIVLYSSYSIKQEKYKLLIFIE